MGPSEGNEEQKQQKQQPKQVQTSSERHNADRPAPSEGGLVYSTTGASRGDALLAHHSGFGTALGEHG
jgi:hypothetical protein